MKNSENNGTEEIGLVTPTPVLVSNHNKTQGINNMYNS